MLRIGQSRRIGEVRRRELQPRRLRVHPFDERFLRARDELGNGHRCVVARLDDDAVQKLVDADRLARLDEHPRALGLPRTLRYLHHLRWRDGFRADRAERDVGGHQLRQRRRIAALVGIRRAERLAGQRIDQHPRSSGDARRPRCALRLHDDRWVGGRRGRGGRGGRRFSCGDDDGGLRSRGNGKCSECAE